MQKAAKLIIACVAVKYEVFCMVSRSVTMFRSVKPKGVTRFNKMMQFAIPKVRKTASRTIRRKVLRQTRKTSE